MIFVRGKMGEKDTWLWVILSLVIYFGDRILGWHRSSKMQVHIVDVEFCYGNVMVLKLAKPHANFRLLYNFINNN